MNPDIAFAIHSVGKVFTGMLDQPFQLDQKVVDALPKKVRDQLSNTTLRQVMHHQGRYVRGGSPLFLGIRFS